MTEQENIDKIREYLEKSYVGARMEGAQEAMVRLSRAIAAFDAPTDIEIRIVQVEAKL